MRPGPLVLSRFGVLVHERCDQALDRPTCGHHHELPIANGHEALDRLLRIWGQPGPLGYRLCHLRGPEGIIVELAELIA